MSALEWIAQIGGVGAVFGLIMVWVYRKDREASEKRMRDDRIFMEDRMATLIENYREDCDQHTEAFGKMRDSLVELTTWLKRKNGN